MTGPELRKARYKLGAAWGLDRPLNMGEMARACGLASVTALRDYETGKSQIKGPLAMLVTVYLAGALPPEAVRP